MEDALSKKQGTSMIESPDHKLIAHDGEIYRELKSLRRKRALFHLSFEGTNNVVLSNSPEKFVVVASFKDDGYMQEPLRANIIAMNNYGSHEPVEFTGTTPADLIDTMIKVHDEWFSKTQAAHAS